MTEAISTYGPQWRMARIPSRYPAAAFAMALATIVPFASAANLRVQAGEFMTAGDIYFNIARGTRVQDYLSDGQAFSVPVLWLCSMLIIALGAITMFVPPRLDIECVRLLASRTRASYWVQRGRAVIVYVALQLLWRVVCCSVIPLALAGSPDIGSLSSGATSFFSMEGPVSWSAGALLSACLLEFVAISALSLCAGALSVTSGAAVGATAFVGYVIVSVFAGFPVLVPNILMLHRYLEYEMLGLPLVWFAIGLVPVLAVSAPLLPRLRTIDFLH